jgi:hypothetical protein
VGAVIQALAAELADRRPAPEQRCFTSASVEAAIRRVGADVADPQLRRLFANTLPNTLDTAVRHADLARPLTFVVTGDIAAMWHRDAVHQIWPYLRFVGEDPALARLVAGVLNQLVDFLLIDPWANAFEPEGSRSPWAGDLTQMHPRVHERKWELDSPAAVMRLSHRWWQASGGDTTPFDARWREAMAAALGVLRQHQGRGEASPYRFQRRTSNPLDSLVLDGRGPPSAPLALVRSAFRPSDDACSLPFHVPSNFMAAAALEDLAELAHATGASALAADAARLGGEIRAALDALPVPWPYELDGFGSLLMMDDANVPSLLSLPWLGAVRADDARWRDTRRRVLSGAGNPFYVRGRVAAGVGSPHTGARAVWPLALVMQALTAENDAERTDLLRALLAGSARTGFLHEAFDADDPTRFTRPWFAWANSMFGELVLSLHETHPHVLKEFEA